MKQTYLMQIVAGGHVDFIIRIPKFSTPGKANDAIRDIADYFNGCLMSDENIPRFKRFIEDKVADINEKNSSRFKLNAEYKTGWMDSDGNECRAIVVDAVAEVRKSVCIFYLYATDTHLTFKEASPKQEQQLFPEEGGTV